jgi:hypothetical protein
MRPDLEEQILRRWPDWFKLPDGRCSLMDEHIQCGDGWFGLIVATFETIEPYVAALNRDLARHGARFAIFDVREKIGLLQITAMPTGEAIFTAFLDAKEESRHICEHCGAPGSLRTERDRGWVRCERCDP